MAPKPRGAVWAILCLLLGERILALRERQTRGGESTNDDAAPLLGSAESQDWDFPPGDGAVAPPVWTKGGCGRLKKNPCTWLQCKHEEYKTGLLAKKYQNEVEAGAEIDMGDMAEEDRLRLMEDRFLGQHRTRHLLFKAMAYWRKGLLRDCSWALADGAESFEGWLQQLLPWRYACVTGVVSTFKPEKEDPQHIHPVLASRGGARRLCLEGFTHNFKEKLHDSCEPEGSSERNPYKLDVNETGSIVGRTLVGGGAVSFVAEMVVLVSMLAAGLPLAALAVVTALVGLLLTGTFAFVVVTLVRLYCKLNKKKEQKHAERELSPSSQ